MQNTRAMRSQNSKKFQIPVRNKLASAVSSYIDNSGIDVCIDEPLPPAFPKRQSVAPTRDTRTSLQQRSKINDKITKLKKKRDISDEGEAINLLYKVMMNWAVRQKYH